MSELAFGWHCLHVPWLLNVEDQHWTYVQANHTLKDIPTPFQLPEVQQAVDCYRRTQPKTKTYQNHSCYSLMPQKQAQLIFQTYGTLISTRRSSSSSDSSSAIWSYMVWIALR